jgi:NAD(P)-dependent dehydrogenase (short-subunit alcohol dehydrogenase family)
MTLAGEIAVVTGASGGLGRQFAVALAGEGATVVATARRKDRLASRPRTSLLGRPGAG